MSTGSPGIKSITSRLENIESNLSNITEHNVLEPSFVSQIHQKEKEVKKKDLNRKYQDIKDKYIDEVNKWVKEPMNEITKVVEVTVHYVEKIAPIVGQIFGVIVKGESKLNLALELIDLVINVVDIFMDSDLLKNIINHFVVIFDERQTLSRSQSTSLEPKRKRKSFFRSIKLV